MIGPLTGLARCVRAEWTKGSRQRLPWVGLVVVAAAAALAPWAAASIDQGTRGPAQLPDNAFRFAAVGLQYGLAFGGLFVVLVASLAIAAEAGHGTWKMVLVRPVARGEVVAAKACVALGYALVVLAVVTVVALAVGGAVADYRAVIDPEFDTPDDPYVFTEAAAMWAHLQRALWLAIPALLATAAFGLAASATFDAPGGAVGAGMIGFFALGAARVLFDGQDAARWIFIRFLPTAIDDRSYVQVMKATAEGFSDAGRHWPDDNAWWAIVVPAASTALLLGYSWLRVRRRAVLS